MPSKQQKQEPEIHPNRCSIELKRLRLAKGWDQEDIEVNLKALYNYTLDRSNVSRLESGGRLATGPEICLLAHLFGVSPHELAWGVPDPQAEHISEALQSYSERFAKQRNILKKKKRRPRRKKKQS